MSLLRLNMVSYIFYVPMLLMSFIGAVFIVLELDNHYMVNKIKFPQIRYYGWVAIMYAMIAVPLGMLLAKKIFRIENVSVLLKKMATFPLVNHLKRNDIIVKSFLWLLSILAIMVLVYTYYQVGTVPIMEMIKGSDNLARLRQIAGREFAGNEYVRNLFGIQLLPVLAFISWAYFQKSKNSIDFLWFVLMFLSSLMMLTYDLQKSAAALFLTGFIFYTTFTKGSIKPIYLGIAVLLFFGVILTFYLATSQASLNNIFLSYNEGPTGRILFSGIAGAFLSFEHFDYSHEFIGNRSLSSFVELFSMEYSERSSRIIMQITNPAGVREGTAGVVNSLFVGEAWANYGFLGLMIAPFYVGFIIGSLYYLFLKSPKTPIIVGLYVFFSYKTSIGGGFNDYIYNIGYVFIFLLFIGILYVADRLNQKLQVV
jgi:hypothetical protein